MNRAEVGKKERVRLNFRIPFFKKKIKHILKYFH